MGEEEQIKTGKIYGKEIRLKKASIKEFVLGLSEGDALIREILEGHIILQNAELFVNLLWQYYGR